MSKYAMAKVTKIKQEKILPPEIKGTKRGELELIFKEINWTHRKYSKVKAHIVWWGENCNSATKITLSCDDYSRMISKPNVINYSLHTSSSQFSSYLSKCEPIEIKLYSVKTESHIGTAFLRIPKNLRDPIGINGILCKTQTDVFSPSNLNLGSISITIKVLFVNKLKKEIEPLPLLEKVISDRASYEFTSSNCSTSTEGIEIISDLNLSDLSKGLPYFSATPSNQTSRRFFTTLDKSSRSVVVDYLTGQNMSKDQEKKALSDICTISPPESLIEAIHNATERSNELKGNVRIHIKSIQMTHAGLSTIKPRLPYYFMIELYVGNRNFIKFVSNKTLNVNDANTVYELNFYENITLKSDLSKNHSYKFCIYLHDGVEDTNFLGRTIINFDEICESKMKILQKKYPITCNDECFLIGTLNLQFIYTDENRNSYHSSYFNKENLNLCNILPSSGTSCHLKKTETPNPNSCNRDKQEENYDNKQNQMTKQNVTDLSQNIKFDNNNMNLSNINFDQNSVKVTMQQKTENFISFLQGLLHIGEMENVTPLFNGSYFIVCRSFWKDVTCTKIWQNNSFNYLDIFSILCNKEFLERTRNNFLILELWQKTLNITEQLVGIVRLPLHKFYIAFSDPTVIDHLRQSKYPIISIDGSLPIASPLTNDPCGLLQVILAIGTDQQIEYLKITRNLQQNTINDNLSVPNIKIPNFNMETQTTPTLNDVEIQTNFTAATTTTSSPERNEKFQKFSAAEKLNAFIDSLSQLRPARTERETNLDGEVTQQAPQIRKTSDLLDMLHKALIQQPSPSPSPSLTTTPPPPCTSSPTSPYSPVSSSPSSVTNLNIDINESDLFKVLIEIENALHLPKSGAKINKKNSKRGKGKNNRTLIDVEPSSYVTFHAIGPNTIGTLKSNDGPVYTTNIVEKSCSPQWKKRFEVLLPVEMLTNSEQKFKLKVLTKQCTDIPQCRLIPVPSEDIIIGTISIDLTVLSSGLPSISGWFNIIDYAGRCNGQIKINIQPLQNLSRFREVSNLRFQSMIDPISMPSTISTTTTTQTPSTIITSAAAGTTIPNVDNLLPVIDTNCDLSSTFLSRALKRKFTELEEITERLKTRLQDVTDECHHMELDDEFENDLNTMVNEDDYDDNINKITDEQQINFDWLKKDQFTSKACEFQINKIQTINASTSVNNAITNMINIHCDNSKSDYNKQNDNSNDLQDDCDNHKYEKTEILYTNEDNNKINKDEIKEIILDEQPQQQLSMTGCTKRVTSKDLIDILKNIDLDTIINPNILKSFINPSLVSTEQNTPRDLNIVIDEELFTPSTSESSSSEYRVKIISDALQKTVLTDTDSDVKMFDDLIKLTKKHNSIKSNDYDNDDDDDDDDDEK